MFSAVLSSRSVPGEVLLLAARDAIRIRISQQIVEEQGRSLFENCPERLDLVPSLFSEARIEVVEDPDELTVEHVIEYLPYPPDAAVLAAALEAPVDGFVTGDKTHVSPRRRQQTELVSRSYRLGAIAAGGARHLGAALQLPSWHAQ